MKLAIFDLDQTLLSVNSSFHYYFHLFLKQKISPFSALSAVYYFIHYRFLGLSTKDLHQKVFHKYLKGQKMSHFLSEIEHFLEKNLPLFWNQPMMEQLQTSKKNNDYLLVLSNSPDFLVSKIVKKLPIDEFCASSYTIKDDIIVGINELMDGRAKALYGQKVAERLSIPKEDIVVYTDSIADLPLMEIAGNVIAARGADKKLKQLCMKNNWKIV